jgi:arylsulfatase A
MRELRGLSRLALREQTIADLFKGAGYVTGLVGKWHNGTVGRAYHPCARGFDEFVGFRGGVCDYYDWRMYHNYTMVPSDGRYVTDVFGDEAVSFLRRRRGDPFFLHVAFNAPHTPLQAPPEEIAPFAETGRFTPAVATVYGMIHRMDSACGMILDELERLGLAGNTIVVFASDNGPQFGGQGDECTNRFNGQLAGSKGKIYEGGIRVPGVIRWPGRIEGGRQIRELVHFTDWLPTLLAAAGIVTSTDLRLDGDNVLPLLTGEPQQVNDRRFWQWNRYAPESTVNAAMRDGPWKLLRPPLSEAMAVDPADYRTDREVERDPERYRDVDRSPLPVRVLPPPGNPLLFNLDQDPGETQDLADQEPERANRMLSELEQWFAEVEAERTTIAD